MRSLAAAVCAAGAPRPREEFAVRPRTMPISSSTCAAPGVTSPGISKSMSCTPILRWRSSRMPFGVARMVPGSISVTVNPVNDAPDAGSPAALSTSEDVAISGINVLGFASDVDGDTVRL